LDGQTLSPHDDGLARTMAENNVQPDELAMLCNTAKLVKKIVDVRDRYGPRPATVPEARGIPGFRSA